MTEQPLAEPGHPQPLTWLKLAVVVCAVGGVFFVTVGVATQVSSVAFGMWFTEVFGFFAVPYIALRRAGAEPLATAG